MPIFRPSLLLSFKKPVCQILKNSNLITLLKPQKAQNIVGLK
ncbi:hypothetical protein BTN50_1758 (plasmid) [Candidatus Enterovibrio altilux]|uniref:Uncharacterized protein n=1 Tax=Candidatus Enterovibrio altilux TaxID=1927128 RepID=A0A291BB02_9GAMM|nr:hypothetical protein BTN50_1758 [Candidatus Enterovibrio luxaltus]